MIHLTRLQHELLLLATVEMLTDQAARTPKYFDLSLIEEAVRTTLLIPANEKSLLWGERDPFRNAQSLVETLQVLNDSYEAAYRTNKD